MRRLSSPLRVPGPVLVAAVLSACGGVAPSMRAPETEPKAMQPFAAVAVVDAGPLAGMHFRHYGVNPTVDTTEEPRSSFALSADTATWEVTRTHLAQGRLPEPAVVRIEDFVTAFHEDAVPAPTDGVFALESEAFPSPNRPGYHVLRLALKARQAPPTPVRLVAVVDVAADPERLALARETLRQAFAGLGSADEVGLVAGDGRVLLAPQAPGAALSMLADLETSPPVGQAGLAAAYTLASQGAHQRQVIYCGDGRADREARAFDAVVATAEAGAALGVGLTAVGLGPGRYDDDRLARLARAGRGRYLYVDAGTAALGLAERLPTHRPVVAREVRAEVAFDPTAVIRYRLLGYERHAERAADTVVVPGGDVVAGQANGILYEVKLAPGNTSDLGMLSVRYRPMEGGPLATFQAPLPRRVVRPTYEAASGAARLALVVAALGEKLRGAYWVRGVGYPDLLKQFEGLPADVRQRADARGLGTLLGQAAVLDQRGDPFAGQAPAVGMDFDHVPVVQ